MDVILKIFSPSPLWRDQQFYRMEECLQRYIFLTYLTACSHFLFYEHFEVFLLVMLPNGWLMHKPMFFSSLVCPDPLLDQEHASILFLKYTLFQTSIWVFRFFLLSWPFSGIELRNYFLSSFGAAEKGSWLLLLRVCNIRDNITHWPCTECLENTPNCVSMNMCSS